MSRRFDDEGLLGKEIDSSGGICPVEMIDVVDT